jgi:hypothetical protein
MYLRRLLISTQHHHVQWRKILSTTPSSSSAVHCFNSRSKSSNKSSDDETIIQLFRDISDRSLSSSRRDKVGRIHHTVKEQNKRHPRISAANVASNLCRAYLSLPNPSLSQWRKGDEHLSKQQFIKVLFDNNDAKSFFFH